MQTLKTLPRTPSEAGLIPVALKRKLEYKTTHLKQLIDIKKIYKFLHYLKYEAKNKYYQFYDDYNVFMERCDQKNTDDFDEDILEDLDICQNKETPIDEVNVDNDSDWLKCSSGTSKSISSEVSFWTISFDAIFIQKFSRISNAQASNSII